MQTLALQLQLGDAGLVLTLLAMLAGDFGVALAEVGVMDDVGVIAPVAGQTFGTSQGFARADHILRRRAEDILVLLDLLEHLPGLLQALFGLLLVGAPAE
ncbi:hypothetical protein D3C77_717800 [compost metagenome]